MPFDGVGSEQSGSSPSWPRQKLEGPVLVLLSYFIGPTPMDLRFWPGAIAMMLIATLTAALVTSSGKSAWFVGVLLLMVYLTFAMTLYLLPPETV